MKNWLTLFIFFLFSCVNSIDFERGTTKSIVYSVNNVSDSITVYVHSSEKNTLFAISEPIEGAVVYNNTEYPMEQYIPNIYTRRYRSIPVPDTGTVSLELTHNGNQIKAEARVPQKITIATYQFSRKDIDTDQSSAHVSLRTSLKLNKGENFFIFRVLQRLRRTNDVTKKTSVYESDIYEQMFKTFAETDGEVFEVARNGRMDYTPGLKDSLHVVSVTAISSDYYEYLRAFDALQEHDTFFEMMKGGRTQNMPNNITGGLGIFTLINTDEQAFYVQ